MKKFAMKTALAAMALTVCATAPALSWDYKPKDVYIDESPRKFRKKAAHGDYRFIHVESHYGPRSVIVPVRLARLGKQVKLPGGAWVYCEITCEYTVRRQSLDFWEGQGKSGFTSPGYFRRDFYLDRR